MPYKLFSKRVVKLFTIAGLCLVTNACVGTIVGAAVDTTIEVAKVPFKVAGAVVDVATGGDGDDKKNKKNNGDDD